jgi:hypothetical protein
VTARRAAAALALLLAGCPFHARAPAPQPDQGGWAAVRDAATRRYELYDGLVHRATATATFLGPEEREARARVLGDWLAWTDAEFVRRLAEQKLEAARQDEFVLVLYTADKADNDLDALRSVWRVVVVRPDGTDVAATRITALDSDVTLRKLFPWLGTFDVAYSVRFPPGTDPVGGKGVLLLASANGKIPLDYGVPAKEFTVPKVGP